MYTAKEKSSFSLSSFLRGSSTKATAFLILACLNDPNKIKIEVWFYVLMTTTSKSMVFFDHQNKCRHARGVEVSSLYMGDSSFDHVLLHSPTVPRLASMHQKTITLHSHCKTGDALRSSGM
jgi:hypothetical protein